jgi:5-methylcytosine-specific restriction endonuclease McrA
MGITKERYNLSPEKFCIGGWWKGKKRKPFTQEHRDKLIAILSKRKVPSGDKHCFWKGGISKDRKKWFRDYYATNQEYRRKKLFNNWVRQSKGQITLEILQQIYEDNIKRYGTLTCYLCLHPTPFGKDHLEHKIPLSRGGKDERDNLDIACQHCNLSKGNKTVEEFKQYQQKGNM